MLLLAGCIENGLSNPEKPDGFTDSASEDSGPVGTETGDTAPPPDTASPDECDVELPPDGVVTPDPFCEGTATSPSWDLSIRSATPLNSYACEVHASRAEDVDGDGAITTADPMQLWVDDGWDRVSMYDADGTWRIDHALGAYRAMATVGDVDPTSPGTEAVVGWYEWRGSTYITVGDESGSLYDSTVPEDTSYPWLADLEGDGVPEVVAGGRVFDATNGSLLFDLEGLTPEDSNPPISADLDGDGVQEIISGLAYQPDVRIYESDGSLRNICWSTSVEWGYTSFAVGNLDADDAGEVVAAGDGFVVECDSDGTLIREADVGTVEPPLIAIAELDGDAEPEIFISDYWGVIALEADLTVKWTYSMGSTWLWYPLSVADLDNDGKHEVLVHVQQDLRVLSPDGAELATVDMGSAGYACWTSQPIVADIDADGLAEIVVGDQSLTVITNADGGWTLPEADQPWPGNDRFPGDRTEDGGLPPAEAWWLDPGRNVFQGLPAGSLSTADLAVEIVDVCVADCAGDGVVTVEVANYGAVAVDREITVNVWSIDGGDLLGSATMAPSLASGVSRSVLVDVPAARIAEGLRAEVSAAIAECGVVGNEDEWRDSPCP